MNTPVTTKQLLGGVAVAIIVNLCILGCLANIVGVL